MKSRRFSEEQIIGVLKEAEAGAKRPSTQWSSQDYAYMSTVLAIPSPELCAVVSAAPVLERRKGIRSCA